MGPKIRAAIEFVETTGREVLITSSARLLEAVRGKAGTRILPHARVPAEGDRTIPHGSHRSRGVTGREGTGRSCRART
jgi:hypothetical protein